MFDRELVLSPHLPLTSSSPALKITVLLLAISLHIPKMTRSLPHITINNHLVVLLSWRASAHHIFHQFIVADRNAEVIDITLPLACVALGTSSILFPLKENGYCIHVECVPKNYASYAMVTHAINIHIPNTITMVTMHVLKVLYSAKEELEFTHLIR